MIKSRIDRQTFFRILDANLNRSREGLRVCEDIARFLIVSPAITQHLKDVRHAISDIARSVPACKKLVNSRDAASDIGRRMRTESEMKRCDFEDIFAANIERVKESVRVLEELFKLIDRRSSARFADLRFKVYEIEKSAIKRISSMARRGAHIA